MRTTESPPVRLERNLANAEARQFTARFMEAFRSFPPYLQALLDREEGKNHVPNNINYLGDHPLWLSADRDGNSRQLIIKRSGIYSPPSEIIMSRYCLNPRPETSFALICGYNRFLDPDGEEYSFRADSSSNLRTYDTNTALWLIQGELELIISASNPKPPIR